MNLPPAKLHVDRQRRRLLQSLSAGVLGLPLSNLLALEGSASPTTSRRAGRARNVLVIYEEGGISQMDTWDPKPHAPLDHRSPYRPISTNVPGIQYSELMPNIARHADKLSVVRSMTTARVAGHREGCLEFFSGYRYNSGVNFPDIGSVVNEVLESDCHELPGYVFVPGANMPNAVTRTAFLHPGRAPWKLGTKSLGENVADPQWRVKSLDPQPGLDAGRMAARRDLLRSLDHSPTAKTLDAETLGQYYDKAFNLLTSSQVQSAFSFSPASRTPRSIVTAEIIAACATCWAASSWKWASGS